MRDMRPVVMRIETDGAPQVALASAGVRKRGRRKPDRRSAAIAEDRLSRGEAEGDRLRRFATVVERLRTESPFRREEEARERFAADCRARIDEVDPHERTDMRGVFAEVMDRLDGEELGVLREPFRLFAAEPCGATLATIVAEELALYDERVRGLPTSERLRLAARIECPQRRLDVYNAIWREMRPPDPLRRLLAAVEASTGASTRAPSRAERSPR